MQRKFKQNDNSTIINKANKQLSPQITEHKTDHDIGREHVQRQTTITCVY
jgi:hypothetical protein